jgi:hypothetical protein
VALLELSDRVLDSGINQFLPTKVHAVAMSALAHPSMPWRVQERIWTGLTENNLVHLIDIDSTMSINNVNDHDVVASTAGDDNSASATSASSTHHSTKMSVLIRALSDVLHPLDSNESLLPNQTPLHPSVTTAIKRVFAALRRAEDAELRVFRCLKTRLSAKNGISVETFKKS